MAAIVDNSSKTLAGGGEVASDDIPKDGTGRTSIEMERKAMMRRSNIYAGVTKLDPWLSPFKDALRRRYAKAHDWIKKIDSTEGSLDKFSKVGLTHRLHERKPLTWRRAPTSTVFM